MNSDYFAFIVLVGTYWSTEILPIAILIDSFYKTDNDHLINLAA